ncbi:bifunctional hydroxymethylpyrimidine kinase/phosphomethylpyrimidine kinase [Stigmatella sp. ncwal1]|uniref:Bifunctional hydroxymethylpyrimidine kinase/phosphomethylpyrimidine kinase n=1 Tax=Stigmatella ashevillensis TaxID=2995309 RepID=A0ABT5DAE9_9BACT|nr:bifunctional hydroxymethylpyrimidine kinase/phosphomethylpyrimidine kinase [Stigmatella ashevillena]MDC0709246.1 bifunctional hydroxymethylpyrimidine kinase/phosphomethylpyrimidine kinase [Stigmatella ashevillena]
MSAFPRVLLLAGHEPTGRAGLLADLSTVRALGAAPVAIPTVQTAQGITTFQTEATPPRLLRAQVAAARELGPLHAVKLGVVPDALRLGALREALRGVEAWWVVDPVVRSSRGESLSRLSARHYLALAGPRVAITPNLEEAAWLLGLSEVRTVEEAAQAGQELVSLGFGAVFVKGGHRARGAVDVLCLPGQTKLLTGVRVARRPGLRGTGCRLASALAVELGRGRPVDAAARRAKAFVTRYLRTGQG